MKEIFEVPEQGQFVATWTYEGKLWSETYTICPDGRVTIYCPRADAYLAVGNEDHSGAQEECPSGAR